MTPPASNVDNAAIKVVSVWALVGITSWADVASALAAVYSACLLVEWIWKRLLRPYAENRGWVKVNRER